jgi:hypothetical protein
MLAIPITALLPIATSRDAMPVAGWNRDTEKIAVTAGSQAIGIVRGAGSSMLRELTGEGVRLEVAMPFFTGPSSE